MNMGNYNFLVSNSLLIITKQILLQLQGYSNNSFEPEKIRNVDSKRLND